jgi:hypothetical protein
MVSNVFIQPSFDQLEEYLSHGQKGRNYVGERSERVDWETGRNVGISPTIKQAKALMKETARDSRVENEVYQIILSWQSGNEEEGIPPDDPSREEMETSVDRVLESLELEEHEAWIVSHNDTATPHVHVMVNRVHPTEKKAWEPTYDQTKIYDTLRELEREYGWYQAGPDTVRKKQKEKGPGSEIWEEKMDGGSVRTQAEEEGLREELKDAEDWAEVEAVVDGFGAKLKPTEHEPNNVPDGGLVLEKSGIKVAMSSIDSEMSRPKLEEKFGQTWEEYRRRFGSREEVLYQINEETIMGGGDTGIEENLGADALKRRRRMSFDSNREDLGRSALEETGRPEAVKRNQARRPEASPVREGFRQSPIALPKERLELMPEPNKTDATGRNDLREQIEHLRKIEEKRQGYSPSDQEAIGKNIGGRYETYDDLRRHVGKQINQMSQGEKRELLKSLRALDETRDQEEYRERGRAAKSSRSAEDAAAEASIFQKNEEIYELASDFYQKKYEELPESPRKDYIDERAHGQAEEVEIGYAPDAWGEFKEHAWEHGYDNKDLLDAGMAIERKDGSGVFDKFKGGQVVVVSRNQDGKIRKIQGRTNEEIQNRDIPELNYDKVTVANVPGHEPSEAVFPATEAMDKKGEEVLIAEGFSDALAARDAGRNAVSVGNSNFKEEQADFVAEIAGEENPRVVVIMDGDDAGRTGSVDVVQLMEERGIRADVVRPPEEMDIDDMAKEGMNLGQYIEQNREDGLRYVHENAAIRNGEVKPSEDLDMEDKASRFEAAVEVAASAPSAEQREENFQRLRVMEEVDRENLEESFKEKLIEKGHGEATWMQYQDEPEARSQEMGMGTDRAYFGNEASQPNTETESSVPEEVPESAEELLDEMYLGEEGLDPAIETEQSKPEGKDREEESIRFEAENGHILVEEHADPGAKKVVQNAGGERTVKEPLHEEAVYAVTSTVAGSEEEAGADETEAAIAEEFSRQYFDGELQSEAQDNDLDVESYLQRRREAVEEDRVPGTNEVVQNLDQQVSLQELKEHRDRITKDLHESQKEAYSQIGAYKEKNQTVKDLSQQVGDGKIKEGTLSDLKNEIDTRDKLRDRLNENLDDRLDLRSRLDAANRVIEERDGELSKRAWMVRKDLADERGHIGDKINWEMETQAEVDKQARQNAGKYSVREKVDSAERNRTLSSIKRSLEESKEAAETMAEEAELERKEGEGRAIEIMKSEMPKEEDLLAEFKTEQGAIRVQYSDYMDRRIVEQWSYEDLDDIQLDGGGPEIGEGSTVQSEEMDLDEFLETTIIGEGDRPIKVNYDRSEEETAERISQEVFDGEIVESTDRDRSQERTNQEAENSEEEQGPLVREFDTGRGAVKVTAENPNARSVEIEETLEDRPYDLTTEVTTDDLEQTLQQVREAGNENQLGEEAAKEISVEYFEGGLQDNVNGVVEAENEESYVTVLEGENGEVRVRDVGDRDTLEIEQRSDEGLSGRTKLPREEVRSVIEEEREASEEEALQAGAISEKYFDGALQRKGQQEEVEQEEAEQESQEIEDIEDAKLTFEGRDGNIQIEGPAQDGKVTVIQETESGIIPEQKEIEKDDLEETLKKIQAAEEDPLPSRDPAEKLSERYFEGEVSGEPVGIEADIEFDNEIEREAIEADRFNEIGREVSEGIEGAADTDLSEVEKSSEEEIEIEEDQSPETEETSVEVPPVLQGNEDDIGALREEYLSQEETLRSIQNVDDQSRARKEIIGERGDKLAEEYIKHINDPKATTTKGGDKRGPEFYKREEYKDQIAGAEGLAERLEEEGAMVEVRKGVITENEDGEPVIREGKRQGQSERDGVDVLIAEKTVGDDSRQYVVPLSTNDNVQLPEEAFVQSNRASQLEKIAQKARDEEHNRALKIRTEITDGSRNPNLFDSGTDKTAGRENLIEVDPEIDDQKRLAIAAEVNYDAVRNADITDGEIREVENVGEAYFTSRSRKGMEDLFDQHEIDSIDVEHPGEFVHPETGKYSPPEERHRTPEARFNSVEEQKQWVEDNIPDLLREEKKEEYIEEDAGNGVGLRDEVRNNLIAENVRGKIEGYVKGNRDELDVDVGYNEGTEKGSETDLGPAEEKAEETDEEETVDSVEDLNEEGIEDFNEMMREDGLQGGGDIAGDGIGADDPGIGAEPDGRSGGTQPGERVEDEFTEDPFEDDPFPDAGLEGEDSDPLSSFSEEEDQTQKGEEKTREGSPQSDNISQEVKGESAVDVEGLRRDLSREEAAEVADQIEEATVSGEKSEREKLSATIRRAYKEDIGEEEERFEELTEEHGPAEAIQRLAQREDAPRPIREADQAIRKAGDEQGDENRTAYETYMLKEGVQSNNRVLQQTARSEIEKINEAESPNPNDVERVEKMAQEARWAGMEEEAEIDDRLESYVEKRLEMRLQDMDLDAKVQPRLNEEVNERKKRIDAVEEWSAREEVDKVRLEKDRELPYGVAFTQEGEQPDHITLEVDKSISIYQMSERGGAAFKEKIGKNTRADYRPAGLDGTPVKNQERRVATTPVGTDKNRVVDRETVEAIVPAEIEKTQDGPGRNEYEIAQKGVAKTYEEEGEEKSKDLKDVLEERVKREQETVLYKAKTVREVKEDLSGPGENPFAGSRLSEAEGQSDATAEVLIETRTGKNVDWENLEDNLATREVLKDQKEAIGGDRGLDMRIDTANDEIEEALQGANSKQIAAKYRSTLKELSKNRDRQRRISNKQKEVAGKIEEINSELRTAISEERPGEDIESIQERRKDLISENQDLEKQKTDLELNKEETLKDLKKGYEGELEKRVEEKTRSTKRAEEKASRADLRRKRAEKQSAEQLADAFKEGKEIYEEWKNEAIEKEQGEVLSAEKTELEEASDQGEEPIQEEGLEKEQASSDRLEEGDQVIFSNGGPEEEVEVVTPPHKTEDEGTVEIQRSPEGGEEFTVTVSTETVEDPAAESVQSEDTDQDLREYANLRVEVGKEFDPEGDHVYQELSEKELALQSQHYLLKDDLGEDPREVIEEREDLDVSAGDLSVFDDYAQEEERTKGEMEVDAGGALNVQGASAEEEEGPEESSRPGESSIPEEDSIPEENGLTEEEDRSTDDAISEESFKDETEESSTDETAENAEEEGTVEDISVGEYLNQRQQAAKGGNQEKVERLDEAVSAEQLKAHRRGLSKSLREVQSETFQATERLEDLDEEISEAAGRLRDNLGSSERAKAYTDLMSAVRARENAQEGGERGESIDSLQKTRIELTQEIEDVNQVLSERTGSIDDETIQKGLQQTGNRLAVEKKRRDRLEKQSEIDEEASTLVSEYALVDDQNLSERFDFWSEDAQKRAEAASEKVEKISQRHGKFRSVAEKRGITSEDSVSEREDREESVIQDSRAETRESNETEQNSREEEAPSKLEELKNQKANLEERKEKIENELNELGEKRSALAQKVREVRGEEKEKIESQLGNLTDDYKDKKRDRSDLQDEISSVEEQIESLDQDGETSVEVDSTEEVESESTEAEKGRDEEARGASTQSGSAARRDEATSPLAEAAESNGDEEKREAAPEVSEGVENISSERGESASLREEKDRLRTVQRDKIEEVQEKAEYALREGEELGDKAIKMASMARAGASEKRIEKIKREIDQSEQVKVNVESTAAKRQREVQKIETKINRVEQALEERGEMTVEDYRSRASRLEEQAETVDMLKDIEGKRAEVADDHRTAVERVQAQGDLSEEVKMSPSSFDPAAEEMRLRETAKRAREVQKKFDRQSEGLRREADKAQEVVSRRIEGQGVDEEAVSKGSVMEEQMKTDLREIASQEDRSQQAFNEAFRDGESAREKFAEMAYTEGVSPSTRSFAKADIELREKPSTFGEPAMEGVGQRDALHEASKAEKDLARQKARFQDDYGNRTPSEVSQIAEEEGVRTSLDQSPGSSGGSPKARLEAARELIQETKANREFYSEQFREGLEEKYENPSRALEAHEENLRMYNSHRARNVAINPETHVGERQAFERPGQISNNSLSVDQKLREVSAGLEKLEGRIERYREARDTAKRQIAQERIRVSKVEDNENIPETTWDKVQGAPENAIEREVSEGEIWEAKKTLRNQFEEPSVSSQINDVARLVEEDRTRRTQKEMQSIIEEVQGTGSKDIEEMKMGDRLEQETGNNLRVDIADIQSQDQKELISDLADRVSSKQIEEAAKAIEKEETLNGEATEVKLLEEGVKRDNNVLKQAARVEMKKGLDQRDPDVISRVKEAHKEAKIAQRTRPRDSAQYGEEIKTKIDNMGREAREMLDRKAPENSRLEEALERKEERERGEGSAERQGESASRGGQDMSGSGAEQDSQDDDRKDPVPERSRGRERGRGGPSR